MVVTRRRSFLALTLLSFAACTETTVNITTAGDAGSDTGAVSVGPDAGLDTSAPDTSDASAAVDVVDASDASDAEIADGALQSAKLISLDTKAPIANATITVGTATTTTDATGVYSKAVPFGVPFRVTAAAPTFTRLLDQEWKLSGDYDAGVVALWTASSSDTLASTLPGFDGTKGVLLVSLVIRGACTTEGGATIALSPAGTSQLKYFRGGFPSSTDTVSVAGETTPTALFWNIAPGSAYTLTVTSPNCTVAPFPFTDGPVTYTGAFKVEAAMPHAHSKMRVFLQ